MKSKKLKKGICPKCGRALDYSEGELVSSESYKYDCGCICGWNGIEWYDLKFSELVEDK